MERIHLSELETTKNKMFSDFTKWNILFRINIKKISFLFLKYKHRIFVNLLFIPSNSFIVYPYYSSFTNSLNNFSSLILIILIYCQFLKAYPVIFMSLVSPMTHAWLHIWQSKKLLIFFFNSLEKYIGYISCDITTSEVN